MTAHTYHGTQIELDRNDTWRDDAACRDEDPEIFFPHETGSAKPALNICAGCPVRQQCLTWAIDHKQDYGVWGGHTVKERKRLAKNRNHRCQECGTTFHADPRARPKYCPDCRPAVHRRQKQKNQAKRKARQ